MERALSGFESARFVFVTDILWLQMFRRDAATDMNAAMRLQMLRRDAASNGVPRCGGQDQSLRTV